MERSDDRRCRNAVRSDRHAGSGVVSRYSTIAARRPRLVVHLPCELSDDCGPAGDCSRQSVRTLSAAFTLKDCGERIRPAHSAQLLDDASGRRLRGGQ